MATHFLSGSDGGHLQLDFCGFEGIGPGPHCLEMFEMNGQRYLRIWINARTPGGSSSMITCKLSRADAQSIADGAQRLVDRIGD